MPPVSNGRKSQFQSSSPRRLFVSMHPNRPKKQTNRPPRPAPRKNRPSKPLQGVFSKPLDPQHPRNQPRSAAPGALREARRHATWRPRNTLAPDPRENIAPRGIFPQAARYGATTWRELLIQLSCSNKSLPSPRINSEHRPEPVENSGTRQQPKITRSEPSGQLPRPSVNSLILRDFMVTRSAMLVAVGHRWSGPKPLYHSVFPFVAFFFSPLTRRHYGSSRGHV